MIDFDFKRPARRCAATDRELQPGERFVSALVEQADGSLVRRDVAESEWTGPGDDCVGWWIGQVPTADKGRVYWAPHEVLLSFFEHALEQPNQQPLAYVMALVLIRKRVVQWRESIIRNGQTWLMLFDAKHKKDYEVVECELSNEQIASIQNELAEKLFTDFVDPEVTEDANEA